MSVWWWSLWHRRRQTVTLYTRPACPLCDEARAELEMLASRWRYRIEEIDIMADLKLYERYHDKVPVIAVSDEVVSIGRVDAGRLREALQAAR